MWFIGDGWFDDGMLAVAPEAKAKVPICLGGGRAYRPPGLHMQMGMGNTMFREGGGGEGGSLLKLWGGSLPSPSPPPSPFPSSLSHLTGCADQIYLWTPYWGKGSGKSVCLGASLQVIFGVSR